MEAKSRDHQVRLGDVAYTMLAGSRSSTSVPAPDFAPHRQFPSDQRGTFRHAAQAVVSLETLAREHRRIDPLAIVTHAQAELLVVVADLDLDPPGMRVPEGIPKGFRRNLVDLVTDDRVQISRLALDCNTECGRLVGVRVGRELVAEGPDRHGEIVAFDGRRAQALDRVPAFGDRLRRVFNRTSQLLFRFCRAIWQQVQGGLESQQQIRGSFAAACRAAPARCACAR